MSVKQGMKESTVDHLSSETLNLVYLEPVPYDNNNNKKISKSSPGKVCIRHHCFQHRDYFTPAANVLKINDTKQEKSHPCWVYVHLRLM